MRFYAIPSSGNTPTSQLILPQAGCQAGIPAGNPGAGPRDSVKRRDLSAIGPGLRRPEPRPGHVGLTA